MVPREETIHTLPSISQELCLTFVRKKYSWDWKQGHKHQSSLQKKRKEVIVKIQLFPFSFRCLLFWRRWPCWEKWGSQKRRKIPTLSHIAYYKQHGWKASGGSSTHRRHLCLMCRGRRGRSDLPMCLLTSSSSSGHPTPSPTSSLTFLCPDPSPSF